MNKSIAPVSEQNMADIDAALADIVVSKDEVENLVYAEEVIEETPEPTVHAHGVLEDNDLADLDLAVGRQELYEEQTSASIETVNVGAPAATVKKAATKRQASGTASAGRAPRDIAKVADELFVLTGDAATMSDADKAAARAATIALKPNQVKIAEKFENVFSALSVGKKPSAYVMTAFELLNGKKTMSSADLIGAYKIAGLGEGTARSQTGQIMNLFATLKIADRVGQSLTLRSDSNIAERLRSLLAAPSAA